VIKLKHVPAFAASCLLIGGFALDAAAQDRDGNRDRGWRERGRDDGDRGWRGRDDDDDDDDRGRRGRDRDDDDRRWRGRDRDDDDDRRWRGREWRGYYDRGSHCYYVRRRIIDRDGDVIIRRSRVCED
jgi:hypothetical protein